MDPREIALRCQKKAYQISDAKYSNSFAGDLHPSGAFPRLPRREEAPAELTGALREHVSQILRGEWRAFGHLPLKVDDPPKWQHDYLVGRDFQTAASAFKLDHRAQPGGADIKIIWEPNRWNQLVRLAMAAWLLGDTRAQEKCIEWLHDWARKNNAFTGLNWTSGLETGIRLIQFAWIDELLRAAGVPSKTLEELRKLIVPAHVWYTWRYRSFGSSANNHLIGELAGLIAALVRWPAVAKISGSLDQLATLWEKEVLAQFEEDGGNKEQAIGYHFFSFEFCWQSQIALESAGLKVSPQVKERLRNAAAFFATVKPPGDPWDFGDGDNAWVTPLFADERNFTAEWARWITDSPSSPALRYWWGDFPAVPTMPEGWRVYAQSGVAIFRSTEWFLRFDFSPLGYLSIAPHGHLDALHLSVWHKGKPIIIDPGTGTYYADKTVRTYLADWASHNSPHLKTPPERFPRRIGTFLWAQHHAPPKLVRVSEHELRAEITLPYGTATRAVKVDPARRGITISDSFSRHGNAVVAARWKFAPELRLAQIAQDQFQVHGATVALRMDLRQGWRMTRSYNPPEEQRGRIAPTAAELGTVPLESLVSPAFRGLACAPYLAVESSEPGPFELIITAG